MEDCDSPNLAIERKVKKLSLPELKEIFQDHIKADFPFFKRFPWFTLERAWERGEYSAYGYYEGKHLLAYATFSRRGGDPYVLMDFLAVVPELRGQGIGSAFLEELWDTVPADEGIFIEAERVDRKKDDEEQIERRKRIDFYEDNGAIETGVSCHLFGVDYELLYLPADRARKKQEEFFDAVCSMYREIYHLFFGRLCRPFYDDTGAVEKIRRAQ